MRPTKSEAVKLFLELKAPRDLAERYNYNMEMQCNVDPGNGTREEGDYEGKMWHGWVGPAGDKWKSFRIPHDAKTNPHYTDGEMGFDLAQHVSAIGMTGWNWGEKCSEWVGFDFDAIVGHSERHTKKLEVAELQQITEIVENIPWVTLRKSTSGKGLHIYVYLNKFPTANHTEHAAVGRAILSYMSVFANFDFQVKADACVPASAWTLTSEGPRQVSQLIGKPIELMVNGENYPSEDGFFSTGYKEVFEIETVAGHKFPGTGEHPFLTHTPMGYRGQQYLRNWTQLCHLKPGMQIVLNQHKQVEWEGEGNYEEGYTLGWLFGDGYKASRESALVTSKGYDGLYFYPDDHAQLRYFPDYDIHYREEGDCYLLSSLKLRELCERFNVSPDKKINRGIEQASSDFYKGFISAFADTDGSAKITNAGIEISQSDLPRLEAVQRMLLRLGMNSMIYKEHDGGEIVIRGRTCQSKAKYVLRIGRANARVFAEQVGFRNPVKQSRLLEKIESAKTCAKEQFLSTIKSIRSLGIQPVFNAEVKRINSFDLNGAVSHNCGGNMWVWHRKMIGTDGLTILKQGIPLEEVPTNWRDHLVVVSGRKTRSVPQFISTDAVDYSDKEKVFEEITGQRMNQKLDDSHNRLIAWLRETGAMWWWDSDHHMLVTHTIHLKEAHEALQLKGIFQTLATGTERGSDQNCFAGVDEVLTAEGPKKFRDAVGMQKLYVHTDRGFEWIDCEIKSFGFQKTYPMYMGDGSIYHPTANHRWIVRDQKTKSVRWDSFKCTHELVEGKTQLPLAAIELPPIDDDYYRGYAHGFVFGDGWKVQKSKGHSSQDHCEVALFKYDVDLKKVLHRFGNHGTDHFPGHGYVDMVRGLPANWKELPEKPTKSHALGFVLGLASADGSVPGCVHIFQSDLAGLEEVRKLGIFAGLRCGPIRPYGDPNAEGRYENGQQCWKLTISTYNLQMDHLVRRDQQSGFNKRQKCITTCASRIGWENPTYEEVFCAVVPHWQNFTLANGVTCRNCFCFPIRNGAWTVRRHTPGTAEAPTWDQDKSGYTRCYFNRDPDLAIASRASGGVEHPNGGFVFANAADQARATIQMLGASLEIFPEHVNRTIRLKQRDARLQIEMEADAGDNALQMIQAKWVGEGKKWKKVITLRVDTSIDSGALGNYDEEIRHVVNEDRKDAGWVVKSDNNWQDEPLKHSQMVMLSSGMSPKDVNIAMGSLVIRPWVLVNRPFQPEYPGDRCWNRNSPQFRFPPAEEHDPTAYPTWLMILNHLGKGLDESIQSNPWAKINGIVNGADYLKCWVSSIFQNPMDPLPYLFFYSPEQNTGKSTFHDAIQLLMTRGVERADRALESTSGFNGELASAVLCVIEETDLRQNKTAYNRIKDWVNSKMFPVHVKRGTPYTIPNSTHWCVPATQWIETMDGARQVRDLIGQSVSLLIDGESYPTNGFFESGFKSVYEVETVEGYRYRSTIDHEVLTGGGIEFWTESGKLLPGTSLRLHNHRGVRWGGAGDFRQGYLLGWIVGDGTGSLLEVFEPDYNHIQFILEQFTQPYTIRFDRDRFIIESEEIDWLIQEYDLPRSKKLSPFIEEASSDFLAGFISAFFDTDGGLCEDTHRVRLRQSDYERLQMVQRTLLRFGIASKLYQGEKAAQITIKGRIASGKQKFSLYISKDNIRIFEREIGFQVHAKREALAKICQSKLGKESFLARFKSLTYIGEMQVYDVTVPKVHRFSANGFTLHNCQMANDPLSCPIFPNDTRITMIQVPPLELGEMIPRKQLFDQLEREASHFMAALLRMEIPISTDRLAIPIITTVEKENVQIENESLIETFLRENTHYVPGEMIPVSEMWEKFQATLSDRESAEWSKIRMGRQIPKKFPKGRSLKDSHWNYGNISWTPWKIGDPKLPILMVRSEKLISMSTKVIG